MKKIILISGLIFGLILSGCGKDKGLSQDQIFEKKQECISYENKMKQDLSGRYIADMVDTDLHITEVFYSQTRNSCIYVVENTVTKLATNKSYYEIIDFLTKESIESCGAGDDINCYNAKISKKIKELKGE